MPDCNLPVPHSENTRKRRLHLHTNQPQWVPLLCCLSASVPCNRHGHSPGHRCWERRLSNPHPEVWAFRLGWCPYNKAILPRWCQRSCNRPAASLNKWIDRWEGNQDKKGLLWKWYQTMNRNNNCRQSGTREYPLRRPRNRWCKPGWAEDRCKNNLHRYWNRKKPVAHKPGDYRI